MLDSFAHQPLHLRDFADVGLEDSAPSPDAFDVGERFFGALAIVPVIDRNVPARWASRLITP
jgi:hypothetical protein